MEKGLKKITGIVIMLVMMMATFMSGCASEEVTPITAPIEAPTEQDYYVKNVLEAGAWCYNQDIGNLASNTQYVQMAREMSVYKHATGEYDVTMGLNTYRYPKNSQGNREKISRDNFNEAQEDIAYTNAKKRIKLFIDNTSWMKDKDELKQHIDNIPLYTADFKVDSSSGHLFAVYDEADNRVYKNSKISKDMYQECAEYLYTHELVHALCSKTNGGDINKRYCFGFFDEIQTDAITMAMGAYASDKFVTIYQQNTPYAYEYFYVMGEDVIKAYFYGYEEFSEKRLNEIDVFAESLESCWTNGISQDQLNMKKGIASTLLLKWALA